MLFPNIPCQLFKTNVGIINNIYYYSLFISHYLLSPITTT